MLTSILVGTATGRSRALKQIVVGSEHKSEGRLSRDYHVVVHIYGGRGSV